MKLRLRAPAKLNLTLEVLGRRADSFHEVRGVVQAIALLDTLEVGPARDLSLSAPDSLGPDSDNLALRAAVGLRAASGTPAGARIVLTKQIPVGAGLGGGSSDAAAVLRLLAQLWGVPPGTVDLRALAAELGSDVPLFLGASTAQVSGRGEWVEGLPPLRRGRFVVVVPPWQVATKTARVYAAVAPNDYADGTSTRALVHCLHTGQPISQGLFTNSLTGGAERVFPDLVDFRRRLEAATGKPFALSGAGPALFHYAVSRQACGFVIRHARGLGAAVFLAAPLTGPRRIEVLE